MNTIQFGEDVEGYNIRVLNEREIRASAGIFFLAIFISLMLILFRGNFLPVKYVITVFLTDFIIRVFINPKFSPTLIIGRLIVGNQVPEYVGAQQKKFAWIIGILLSATMFILMVVVNSYSPITGIICLTCLVFLFFESAFGICLGCFLFPSLVSSQQYPFITYTTRDGLVSNRVRKMYQDSSGRLFFLTFGGLSIYDGARFTNYNTEDGLRNELINDVMQMAKDSFWVATNAPGMNCLVHGKIGIVKTADGFYPVVNQLYRDKQGKLFAAADEGLFVFEWNRFKRLEFRNDSKYAIPYIRRIEAITDELMLVQVDPGGVNNTPTLFLYNYKLQKTIGSVIALDFGRTPAGDYWVMTGNGLRLVDVNALKENKLRLINLPLVYETIASWVTNNIFFDRDGNCWLASPENCLAKCDPHGHVIVFADEKILSEQQTNEIFQDREGILWINFLQNGASKLPNTDVSLYDNLFGMHRISHISCGHGQLILYDNQSKKLVVSDTSTRTYSVPGNVSDLGITSTAKGIFAYSASDIYKLLPQGNMLKPVKIKVDTSFRQIYNTSIEDRHGNYLVSGGKYLTAVIDGHLTASVPINHLADQLAIDSTGNIWVANRLHELMKFTVHPETPKKYLQLERAYKLSENINVRALSFDSSNRLWIGSRDQGLLKATFVNDTISLLQFSKRDGLTDNFMAWLACDKKNVWFLRRLKPTLNHS